MNPLPVKSVAVGAVILDGSGRVLLVRTADRPYWDLPGGVVEAGESPLDALSRELREELDVRLDDIHLTGVYHVMPRDALRLIFRVQIEGSPRIDGAEILAYEYVEIAKAEGLTVAWVMDRVLDAVEFEGSVAVRAQRRDASGRPLPSRPMP